MANELMALARQRPAAAEDDYRSLCAALETSARGRAFLAEYARRNRQADTEVLLAALARLEARLRADGTALARLRDELRVLLIAIRLARPEIDAAATPAKDSDKAANLAKLLNHLERRLDAMVDDGPAPQAAPATETPSARGHLAVVPRVHDPEKWEPVFGQDHAQKETATVPVQRQEKAEPSAQARTAATMPEVTLFGSAPVQPIVSPPPCGEGLGVGVVVAWQSDRLIAATPLPNPPPQGGREREKVATALPARQPTPNPLATIMALSEAERIALFT